MLPRKGSTEMPNDEAPRQSTPGIQQENQPPNAKIASWSQGKPQKTCFLWGTIGFDRFIAGKIKTEQGTRGTNNGQREGLTTQASCCKTDKEEGEKAGKSNQKHKAANIEQKKQKQNKSLIKKTHITHPLFHVKQSFFAKKRLLLRMHESFLRPKRKQCFCASYYGSARH